MKLHLFMFLVWSASALAAPWVYLEPYTDRELGEIGHPVPNETKGLPRVGSGGDYYSWSPSGFRSVKANEIEKGHFYVKWSPRYEYYVWSDPADGRAVMGGSRVQGWRFGLKDSTAYDWYTLVSFTNATWVRTFSKLRPVLFRDGADPEWAPEEWVNWTAPVVTKPPPVIAPPPHSIVAPHCFLDVSRGQVRTDESLVLSLEVDGPITAAEIDGAPVDPKVLKRIISPRVPGFHQALASVTGPGGIGTCWAQYHVLKAD